MNPLYTLLACLPGTLFCTTGTTGAAGTFPGLIPYNIPAEQPRSDLHAGDNAGQWLTPPAAGAHGLPNKPRRDPQHHAPQPQCSNITALRLQHLRL